jgi:hypothetical protein
MREEIRQEIRRKISESFEIARAQTPPALKKISEERRTEQKLMHVEIDRHSKTVLLGTSSADSASRLLEKFSSCLFLARIKFGNLIINGFDFSG